MKKFGRYNRRHEMIIEVLKRSASLGAPEQKLAFAVIAQAISDLSAFVLFHDNTSASGIDPIGAYRFLKRGAPPYAEGIGLDSDYLVEVVNKPLGEGEIGLLDMARNKIERLNPRAAA